MGRLVGPERPLVHGYLCMEEPNEPQIALWCKDIAVFCETSGFRLGSMFVDRGIPDSSFARSGFIELLAALRLPEAHGVVVPTLAQLSTEEFVQQALTRMVQLTNSRLLVASVVNGSSPGFEPDASDEAGS